MGFRVVSRRLHSNALIPGESAPLKVWPANPCVVKFELSAKRPPPLWPHKGHRHHPLRATTDDYLSPHTFRELRKCGLLRPSSMDEYTADAFANREEPIPSFTVSTGRDGSTSAPERTGKGERLWRSASRVKAIAQELGAEQAQRIQNSGSPSLQDRLFTKYVLPARVPLMNLTSGTGFWNRSYPPKT